MALQIEGRLSRPTVAQSTGSSVRQGPMWTGARPGVASMHGSLQPLVDLLDLEAIDVDLYRGRSPRTDRQRMFGGQVAGQALVAAGRTVPADRFVHSLHAYFLRPGDATLPIIYEVDRIRDGGSFTTRRVVAKQRGKAIFHLSASFQVREPGLEHQFPMPESVDPDSLEPASSAMQGHDPIAEMIASYSAIDLRYAPATARNSGGPLTNQQVWFRATEALPDDPLLHVCVAAYASDLTLLVTALLPHDRRPDQLQMASLDHAMWFHRPFRADEWLLYDETSPSASGARGLAMGHIYTRHGELVASVMQEGLMRPLEAMRDDRGNG
jgi:acyl-CoA thioesterase II